MSTRIGILSISNQLTFQCRRLITFCSCQNLYLPKAYYAEYPENRNFSISVTRSADKEDQDPDPDKMVVPALPKKPDVSCSPIKPEDLEVPTNCCMSGCANCVWVEYAEKLAQIYSDPKLSKKRIRQEISQIDDFMIKSFLEFELRLRKLI